MPVLGVDQLQEILQGGFPDAEVPRVELVNDDFVVMSFAISERHGRPGGTVSGPSLMALADCTAWLSIVGRIGPVALSVTTSLHIDFLRRPELVDVVADGALLKVGRRLAVAEVAMVSVGSPDLIAKAQVTYSIPPERHAV